MAPRPATAPFAMPPRRTEAVLHESALAAVATVLFACATRASAQPLYSCKDHNDAGFQLTVSGAVAGQTYACTGLDGRPRPGGFPCCGGGTACPCVPATVYATSKLGVVLDVKDTCQTDGGAGKGALRRHTPPVLAPPRCRPPTTGVGRQGCTWRLHAGQWSAELPPWWLP